MFSYYLKLALISLRKTPFLSFLMIATIAIGIGAAMTTYTVSYLLEKDPIPSKSDKLFNVRLNSYGPDKPFNISQGKEVPPYILTYQDAINLQNAKRGVQQTPLGNFKMMTRSTEQPITDAKMTSIRTAYRDMFSMFEVPFKFGGAWDESADKDGLEVAVISSDLNDELFNGENSIGKLLLIGDLQYRVVGVTDDWYPVPKFFDYRTRAFNKPRDIIIPFQAQINNQHWTSSDISFQCWKDPEDESFTAVLASECVWVSYWVELSSAAERDSYMDFLVNYSMEQRQYGRFLREPFHRLFDVKEQLVERKIIKDDGNVAVWLAFAFLIVCLLNCMAMMVAKFHSKAGEVGLRRAVGASKQDIFAQFTVETCIIGLLGGILGLVLAQIGLSVTAQLYSHLYAEMLEMTYSIVMMTIVLAVVSAVIFGLLPTLHAAKVQPSSQLKSL
ncbi:MULTISPECIES: ABC transporter permease [Pseudoalteromonas]|uniref:ABC transporter permease n=1 Tax=Pseudoalteromonas TaxID=53246 RepID=UPI001108ADA9|nr:MULTISPECIES: FtsX-like permease family protein [Pseudoalteromonas]MCG9759297.1 ABC transporter permease [Pseudoalteromonas sp. Isolate6]NKC21075.1 FtsX-like permease family protein [Pseudoalteromonas galatheae]